MRSVACRTLYLNGITTGRIKSHVTLVFIKLRDNNRSSDNIHEQFVCAVSLDSEGKPLYPSRHGKAEVMSLPYNVFNNCPDHVDQFHVVSDCDAEAAAL